MLHSAPHTPTETRRKETSSILSRHLERQTDSRDFAGSSHAYPNKIIKVVCWGPFARETRRRETASGAIIGVNDYLTLQWYGFAKKCCSRAAFVDSRPIAETGRSQLPSLERLINGPRSWTRHHLAAQVATGAARCARALRGLYAAKTHRK